MTPTLPEYLSDSYNFTSSANVVKTVQLQDGRISVILNKTIFYPQGGGQPYDTGVIQSSAGKFIVRETRFSEGIVFHIGEFENGSFTENEKVELFVNSERRLLHCRLHTAGHLVDVAMINLGYKMPPTKGYHFADGPYVEYAGDIPPEARNELCLKLEEEMKRLISAATEVKNFMVENKDDLHKYCDFVPGYIPKDKPVRIVTVAGYNCPCGGTHVKNLHELGEVKVTKIKVKSGNVRVSYGLVGNSERETGFEPAT